MSHISCYLTAVITAATYAVLKCRTFIGTARYERKGPKNGLTHWSQDNDRVFWWFGGLAVWDFGLRRRTGVVNIPT